MVADTGSDYTIDMNLFNLVAVSCFAISTCACAASSDDGVAFVSRGPYAIGAAVLKPANGGEYVYSSVPTADGRKPMRFMAGKPQRQDYELFSGEEEAALYISRADQLAAIQASANRTHVRRAGYHAKPKLNWPKVIVTGDRTCVPTLGHASDPDWKNHLVCWNAGEQRVE